MKKVLLLSSGSPCRAVMAEGILRKNSDKEIEFIGAGLEENEKINQNAIKILNQEGVNIDELSPRTLKDVVKEDFDLIVTICSHSRELCPQFPRRVTTIHMDFPVIDDENEESCKELAWKIKNRALPIILKSI